MLCFHPRFIRTFVDVPGHLSLLIHAWNGCNMRCCGCHNEAELLARKPEGQLTPEQTIGRIGAYGDMFDAVIFSGGEFLVNEPVEVEPFLRQVRSVFHGKVILFTNGTFPGKLKNMLDNRLIDGVHIDLKLPFHCMDPADDCEVFQAIIGTVPSKRFCQDILHSVDAVIRHNSVVSQVRTVKYPQLSDEYFEQISAYVTALNAKYGSSVPYFLNPFQWPDSAINPKSVPT